MNRRNGNWLALSINQLTAPAVTGLAALSGYRSIKPAALHPTRRLAGKASRQSLPAVTELRGGGELWQSLRDQALDRFAHGIQIEPSRIRARRSVTSAPRNVLGPARPTSVLGGKSGRYLLLLSVSQFDPSETSTVRCGRASDDGLPTLLWNRGFRCFTSSNFMLSSAVWLHTDQAYPHISGAEQIPSTRS